MHVTFTSDRQRPGDKVTWNTTLGHKALPAATLRGILVQFGHAGGETEDSTRPSLSPKAIRVQPAGPFGPEGKDSGQKFVLLCSLQ